ALARRVVLWWPQTELTTISSRLRGDVVPGQSVAFRPMARPRTTVSGPPVDSWVDSVRRAGGRVDLERPERRFWFATHSNGTFRFGEEAGEVDRARLDLRRMPNLPFRRPVSLPPRLGRVAANLARVRPGDRVVDPFVGTGALAVESAILGARITGIDRDATMVQGAVANFAHLGLDPERFEVADAGEVRPEGSFDSLVTDAPYGRSSTTGGEEAGRLVRRVVSHWARAVREGGRLVVVVPGGPDPVGDPWRRVLAVPDRVHRSLTREFRVFERASGAPPVATAS
ncbi:MAG TPA: methyltransferase domain-containing protein, partial [Thermoplasmata archaeon]|nr:methyltransferase domain-containing protein [Thermoplasmata archaeon]